MPLLARGSALRFLLTRLYDWLNQPAGALVRPKDPLEYLRKLRFHRGIADPTALWPRCDEVEIFTDGACSGNPGPGRLGRHSALWRGIEKEMSGGETATTNNRMEMMAAIAGLGGAETAVHGTGFIPTASICATASRNGCRHGRRAAGAPPTRSR